MPQLIRFDWAMKRLLRSKANFGILEGFLSELLKRDLKILNLLESEGNKADKDLKFDKVDILVELDDGEIVLIEVQSSTEDDYFYRMLFGVSKIVTEYIKEGNPYFHVKKVYSINILYFDLGHGSDYIYHGKTTFIGLHNHDCLDLSEKQKKAYKKDQTHQIYPEYYLIKVNQFNDVAKNTLDEWIYFLKNESIKDEFHAKGLLEAKEKLDSLKLSPSEKLAYKRYMEYLSYEKSMIATNYNSGMIDGMEKGKVLGLEEGEMKAKREAVINLHKAGIDKTVVAISLNLSIEEIEAIVKQSDQLKL